mgnify:CR=1 FL=1
MSEQAPFRLKGRNPDVLSCIANLSNDEVFTPPEFANRMLDTLTEAWAADNDGENIWENSEVTFLDPCTKSGVFLREIAKRLIAGLEAEIPDLQTRVDHILTRQVFGIGITQITALLARRSLYCSKSATGEHSVATGFDDEDGNIWFERTEHDWKGGKCVFCGASAGTLDRGEDSESHAYAFIHTENIQDRIVKIFGDDMQFDVIIGNPPYQNDDGGHGKSAAPIYHHFIEQAKTLEPRFISMVIPARWYSGGKGLDGFRASMLSDNRISELHDYPETSDCFSGINIRGGICYFLWNRNHSGTCKITNYKGKTTSETISRPLLEDGIDIFIRYNRAVGIFRKVRAFEEPSFADLVSSRKPFGLPTNFSDFASHASDKKNILLHRFGKNGFVSREQLSNNQNFVDKFKIIVPYASPGTDKYPHLVLSKPIIAGPGVACTETYLVVGPFETEEMTNNVKQYMSTKFFRFLILLIKNTQHVTKKNYNFVPKLDLNTIWTDQILYRKYGLTEMEINFIESMVKPMKLDLFDQAAMD